MERGLMMAGIGGQGVQLATKVLVHAANHEGKYVLHFAVFGGSMRGGNCRCTVTIGSEPLLTPPIVEQADVAIVMHPNELDGLEKVVAPGGLLMLNSSIVHQEPARKDVRVIKGPFSKMAEEIGNPMGGSMVAIGAFIEATRAVSLASATSAMKEILPERRSKLIDSNVRALEVGADYVRRNIPSLSGLAWQDSKRAASKAPSTCLCK